MLTQIPSEFAGLQRDKKKCAELIAQIPLELIYIVMTYLKNEEIIYCFIIFSGQSLTFPNTYKSIQKAADQASLPNPLPPATLFVVPHTNDEEACIYWRENYANKSSVVHISLIAGLRDFLSSKKTKSYQTDLVLAITEKCGNNALKNDSIRRLVSDRLDAKCSDFQTTEKYVALGANNVALMLFIAKYADDQLNGSYSALQNALDRLNRELDNNRVNYQTCAQHVSDIKNAKAKTLLFYNYLTNKNSYLYRWRMQKTSPKEAKMSLFSCEMYADDALTRVAVFEQKQLPALQTFFTINDSSATSISSSLSNSSTTSQSRSNINCTVC